MATSEDPGDQPARSAGQPRTRRFHWSVSAITFVVGFVVGVVAVGLLSFTVPEFGALPRSGGASPASTPAPSSGATVPVVAEARVNAACLSIINDAQDTYVVLTGLDQAVTDVDLQLLDDIVRRLQPIEARLGRNLQECRVDTDVSAAPTQTANTASPAPTPTVSQTR